MPPEYLAVTRTGHIVSSFGSLVLAREFVKRRLSEKNIRLLVEERITTRRIVPAGELARAHLKVVGEGVGR